MLYEAYQKGPYRVPGIFDPDSSRLIGIIYAPAVWQSAQVYYRRQDDDYDICVPSVSNGFYYRVENPGVSGITEPVWNTTKYQTTTELSGLEWKAIPYNLLPSGTILVASEWLTSDTVTISSESFTNGTAQCLISGVADTLTEFTVTNRITTSIGEVRDASLIFTVGQR